VTVAAVVLSLALAARAAVAGASLRRTLALRARLPTSLQKRFSWWIVNRIATLSFFLVLIPLTLVTAFRGTVPLALFVTAAASCVVMLVSVILIGLAYRDPRFREALDSAEAHLQRRGSEQP
jgi:steroid 5-alpha reductase family enzyme